MTWEKCAIALGSNLGDRRAALQKARQDLGRHRSIRRLQSSSLYETAPLLELDQPDFLNQVLTLETELLPEELLDLLQELERRGGRVRGGRRYGPRPIDLDLLLYGEKVIDSPRLTVPHAGLTERLFFLEPLLEIWPGARHPRLGRPLSEAAAALRGKQRLQRLA